MKVKQVLKNFLKRKVKLTDVLLVVFLFSCWSNFAVLSPGVCPFPKVDENIIDFYIRPGKYKLDDNGTINLTLVNKDGYADENTASAYEKYSYDMTDRDAYNELCELDKERLEKRRVTITGFPTKAGVASAIAMANLPQASSYNEYRHMISAAYGTYGGQSAVSFGVSGITKNNKVTYKLSGSVNSKAELALGAGFGVMLGKAKMPPIEMPTLVKEKLEKSEKERQNLQLKLLEQNEKLNKQAEQIKDLYNIIKELKEELGKNK